MGVFERRNTRKKKMFSLIEVIWFLVKFLRTWPSTRKLNHFMDVISARQVESPIIHICYAGPDPTALSHTNKSPFLISIWCFFQSSGPKVTDRKRRETDCFVATFPWVFLITSPGVERPDLMEDRVSFLSVCNYWVSVHLWLRKETVSTVLLNSSASVFFSSVQSQFWPVQLLIGRY